MTNAQTSRRSSHMMQCNMLHHDERGGIEMSEGYRYGGGFALIVVLFILLIIVGASWF